MLKLLETILHQYMKIKTNPIIYKKQYNFRRGLEPLFYFFALYGIFVKRFLFFTVFLFYNKKGEAIVCKNYFKKKKRIYYLFVFWN